MSTIQNTIIEEMKEELNNDLRGDIELDSEFPAGCCQTCGEPQDDGDEEACFECAVLKANV